MGDSYLSLLKQIDTFVFDVDGVFTDGSVTLMPDGNQVRIMNIKDGFAVQHAIKKGYKIAIISGGKSESVRKRFNGLGVYDVYLGAAYKPDVFEEFCLTYEAKPETILYMGDDIPDLEVMQRVLLPCCPQDAADEIKQVARYISPARGGKGAVRDVIEQVLKIKGDWPNPEKVSADDFKW